MIRHNNKVLTYLLPYLLVYDVYTLNRSSYRFSGWRKQELNKCLFQHGKIFSRALHETRICFHFRQAAGSIVQFANQINSNLEGFCRRIPSGRFFVRPHKRMYDNLVPRVSLVPESAKKLGLITSLSQRGKKIGSDEGLTLKTSASLTRYRG